MLFAQNKALHNDLTAFGQSDVVSRSDVFLFGQFQRNTAGMVAIGGLDAHGQANALRGLPSSGRAVHDLTFGHRHAAHAEQLFGQVLVFGDAFGNGARAVGLCCPDPPLLCPVAKLHQIAVVEADGWDAAVTGRIDDAGCARPNAQAVHHLFEAVDLGSDIKCAVFDGRQNQVTRCLEGALADGFMAGTDHHFVNAPWPRFAGFAKAGLHAGLVLQLEGDMFQHMTRPSALFQSLQETTPFAHTASVLDQAWQPSGQALIEALQGVGGKVFQSADVNQSLHDRAVSPDVRSAQVGHAQKLDVVGVLGVHVLKGRRYNDNHAVALLDGSGFKRYMGSSCAVVFDIHCCF